MYTTRTLTLDFNRSHFNYIRKNDFKSVCCFIIYHQKLLKPDFLQQ